MLPPSASPLLPPPPPPPALSPYGTLSGQLFLYGGGRAAFESPLPSRRTFEDDSNLSNSDDQASVSSSPPTTASSCTSAEFLSPNKCVLLGGLSDGLMPVPYTSELNDACQRLGSWSLVQPVTSSSYLGFGHGSLQRDTAELDELLNYLVCHRNAKAFCFVGHSTGCQNAVHYLEHGHSSLVGRVHLVVLQAPVSDREHAAHENPTDYQAHLEVAQTMRREGRADEMMPRAAFWAPITAQRFLDLHERGGADEYFSSDYTAEELEGRLSHVGRVLSAAPTNPRRRRRALVAFSGSDEYVPNHVDSQLLTTRLVDAMNAGCCALLASQQENDAIACAEGTASADASALEDAHGVVAEALYLPTGNHNLSQGPGDIATFIGRVERLLKAALAADLSARAD